MPEPDRFAARTIESFLHDLASKSPAPGGGAATPMCAAIGAALANMVVAFSVGKKSLAEHRPALEAARERLTAAAAGFTALADDDAAAYARLNALQRLPENDPGRADLPDATRAASAVPTRTITLCVETLDLCASLAPISNEHLLSDLAIAAVMLEACARAARWLVLANADGDMAALGEVDAMLSRASELRTRVEGACARA